MEGVDHLAEERNRAEFDVEEMKIVWAGSRQEFEVSDRMARLVASDAVFRKDNRGILGRKELFKNTLRKAAYAWKRIIELRLSEQEASKLRFFVDEPAFTDLHWGMFVPAIKGQGTDEQQQKWLPLAYKMQIIGCYAQTELGHGSNVQGLETTATFDHETDEFVIHSPTLTSSKWWPGGLGKISTHAVVYARLVINGKEHGVLLSSLSLDDHLPLPGITVGDIGMKFGNGAYNTMDNGVLRFDHVRIPREQMLQRVLQVTREGKCVESNVPRQLIYGTMVYVRQSIVADASRALSRAVCIATRYSAVRRQFGSQDGGLETQTLPLLASAYAFRFVGEWLKWLYTDAHACTAGLKSLTTSVTADAIEECRKLCGGHVYVPACTYEGDNIVLLLQVCVHSINSKLLLISCSKIVLLVARFLMKTVSQLPSGKKPVGTTAYMGRAEHLLQCRCNVQKAEDWLNPSVVLEVFEARAARMSVACSKKPRQVCKSEEGFAELSPVLVEAAVAHCQLIVVSKNCNKIYQEGVKEQLQVLCCIYALNILHKHLGDFIATGCISAKQASLANDLLRSLYSKLRPNAIALVDAFNYGSFPWLHSWPLLTEASLSDSVVPDGYQEYIRPLLKQQPQCPTLRSKMNML
ncbi:hypothetical protein K2173_014432 [Erythroxylum novogranatense]|uniref:Acyl-coenzyme A oxidase n=1 Tax=Erythroxylum novogranatense TaxID=1862640 RepID=A0AAV8S7F8_9ROSI|nr:hypothetical protein K2173_014432 [Erythroxylum novogranatense]